MVLEPEMVWIVNGPVCGIVFLVKFSVVVWIFWDISMLRVVGCG